MGEHEEEALAKVLEDLKFNKCVVQEAAKDELQIEIYNIELF